MEPDRKLCKFCGVELPFYLGFGEDLCPRCLSRLALRGRRVEMEEACVQRDRAERAEDEVKRLETLNARGAEGGRCMRVQPVKPITQAYFQQPTRKEINVRAKVVEYQPDALDWFDRVDRVMEKVWPWIFGFAAVYILAQLARWLLS